MRGRCARGLAVSSVTRLACCDGSRFVGFFGTRVKVKFARCLGSCQLAVTTELLGSSSSSVLVVTSTDNFSGLSCFGHVFGEGCNVSPKTCEGT